MIERVFATGDVGFPSNRTVLMTPPTLLRESEAMMTTNQITEKDTDSGLKEHCDRDWHNGPDGDVLSCFDCFDPSNEHRNTEGR